MRQLPKPAGALVLRCPAQAEGGAGSCRTPPYVGVLRVKFCVHFSSFQSETASSVSAQVIMLLRGRLWRRSLTNFTRAKVGTSDIWDKVVRFRGKKTLKNKTDNKQNLTKPNAHLHLNFRQMKKKFLL